MHIHPHEKLRNFCGSDPIFVQGNGGRTDPQVPEQANRLQQALDNEMSRDGQQVQFLY